MLEPYRMIFVNLIAGGLLITTTFIYKFVYPKKNVNLFYLLLIISLLPIISILRPGDYQSGDFNIHIYRIISFYNSLKEGILMPSWAADLNATYGNPLFIFNYNLPYYVISFFHFIGVSFINSTKLYLAVVMYLSSITMYFTLKSITKNNVAAFIGSIFYLFNPYHLIDIHFKATLGESTIFLIAPLLFLFITKHYYKKDYLYILLIALISSLLFLAHPLLAIVFFALAELYIIFIFYKKKDLSFFIQINLSLVAGFITSIYTWITFPLYSNITFPNPNPTLIFYNFSHFFYSPWKFGLLFQGPHGELELIIGYTQLIIIVILTLFFALKKINKNEILDVFFWLSMFYFFLFLASPFSSFIWQYIPLFWMLLPFGRLMLPIAFITSVCSSIFYLNFKNKLNKKIFIILVLVTIGYTVLNWGHRTLINLDDSFLIKNVPYSTINEGTTAYFLNNKWADVNHFWFDKIPQNHLEIISGKGIVKEISRESVRHEYTIKAITNVTIKENTLFFPGWSIFANGKRINIFPGKNGVINAVLNKGDYVVTLNYEDIYLYKIAKKTSLVFFIILLACVLFIAVRRLFFQTKASPLEYRKPT